MKVIRPNEIAKVDNMPLEHVIKVMNELSRQDIMKLRFEVTTSSETYIAKLKDIPNDDYQQGQIDIVYITVGDSNED